MYKLIRPAMGICRRNVEITPMARISTKNCLYAQSSGSNIGNEAKKIATKTPFNYIIVAGILAGVGFAYYEYQQGAFPLHKDDEKK